MATSASQGSPVAAREPADRLAALRRELARRGVEGFLIPRGDEHQGEYVPAAAERLAWLTGFKGSAGFACVLLEEAAVFVDGRYTLQVVQEVDNTLFTPRQAPKSIVSGKRVSVRVDLGFLALIIKKTNTK